MSQSGTQPVRASTGLGKSYGYSIGETNPSEGGIWLNLHSYDPIDGWSDPEPVTEVGFGNISNNKIVRVMQFETGYPWLVAQLATGSSSEIVYLRCDFNLESSSPTPTTGKRVWVFKTTDYGQSWKSRGLIYEG